MRFLLNFSGLMSLTLLVLLSPTSAVGDVELNLAKREAAHHLRVYRDAGASDLTLPKPFSLVASYGPLLLIRSSRPISSSDLLAIRQVPGVVAVSRDAVVVRPHQDHNGGSGSTRPEEKKCELTERCPNGKPKFWGQDLMMVGLMHQLLDRMQIGAETKAEVAVVDSGFDASQATEFDSVGGVHTERGVLVGDVHPHNKYSKVTHYKENEEVLGDPTKDENGHGTMVSSTIVGKGGIGVAKNVHLSVYRVTKPGTTGSTSSAYLEMSMLKACEQNHDPDGLTVINVSWGGRLDESGLDPGEEDEVMQKVIQNLTDKGCLVVKSSGNDNFRAKRGGDHLDDAYLRVAATDPALGLASFSTLGEVGAPGEDIYVRNTSLDKKSLKEEKACGSEAHKRFVNGTSFAAPFTAGIATQVVRVLKHEGAFKGLSGAQRIALVNRILRASMEAGSINGLRAVAIAGIWSKKLTEEQKKNSLELDSQEGVTLLTGLLSSHPMAACTKEPVACEKVRACLDKKTCIDVARVRVALCPPPDIEEASDLAKTAFEMEGYEIGHYYSRLVERYSTDPKQIQNLRRMAVQGYLRKEGYYDVPKPPKKDRYGLIPYQDYSKRPEVIRRKIFSELPANFMRSTLAPYLEEYVRDNPSTSRDLMKLVADGVLNSYDVKSALKMGFDPTTGEDRGSNSVLDGVHSVLRSSRKAMGEIKFKESITAWVDNHLDSLKFDLKYKSSFEFNHSTPLVRVLNRLIGDETPGSRMHQFYLDQETRILESMRTHNEFYGKETQSLVFAWETYPDRPPLSPFLERHLGETHQAVKDHGLKAISPVEGHFLLEKPERTTTLGRRVDFLLDVLAQIASGRGWKEKNDTEMVETILGELVSVKESVTPEEWEKVQLRFRDIVRNAESSDFVAQLLTGYWEDRAFGVDRLAVLFNVKSDDEVRKKGLAYKSHPLMDQDRVALLSHKGAAALIGADMAKAEDMKLRFELQRGLGVAWKGFGLDSHLDPNEEIVVPSLQERSRLDEETKEKPKTLKISEAGFPEYVLGAISLAENAKSAEMGGKILEGLKLPYLSGYYRGNDDIIEILKRLPATGPWREKVKSFLASNTGYRTHMARFYMERFFQSLDQYHTKEIEEEKKQLQAEAMKELGEQLKPLGAAIFRWVFPTK